MSLESHEQPSVTGHGQNSVSGTELASERTEIMEITADQWPLPVCQALQLVGLRDRFVQFADPDASQGSLLEWTERCGLRAKTAGL